MKQPETPEEVAEFILHRIRSGAINAIAVAATGPEGNTEFYIAGIDETKELTNIIAAIRILDNVVIHRTIVGDISHGPKPVDDSTKKS